MAYSDYGAFVYKDGIRRTDREDVAVFNDDDKDHPSAYRIFANIRRNRKKYPDGNPPWHEHSHHAVLGDGPVRLCGYKSTAELFHLADDGTVTDVDLAPFQVDAAGFDGDTHRGEYAGATFEARQDDGPHGRVVLLSFVEADGAKWEATCGYLYGAGHMDGDG